MRRSSLGSLHRLGLQGQIKVILEAPLESGQALDVAGEAAATVQAVSEQIGAHKIEGGNEAGQGPSERSRHAVGTQAMPTELCLSSSDNRTCLLGLTRSPDEPVGQERPSPVRIP